MSVLSLIQLSREQFEDKHTPLRSVSDEVLDLDTPQFQRDLVDLVETFKSHRIAVGLAAPQIGKSIRVAVININKEKPEPHLVLVNPRIISQSEDVEKKYESCMSLPHYRGKVIRAKSVIVEYQDQSGVKKDLSAEGFLARVIQHEVDHLNGVLFIDRMSSLTELEPVEFFKDDGAQKTG